MTNSAASVTRNALVLTTLKTATPALSMIVVLAVSRTLGTEGLGRYTLVTTFLGFLITVTPLGLNAFLMREGARDVAGLPKLFANAVGLGVVASLLVAPILPLVGLWLHYDALTRQALVVMSLAILPATLLVLCDAVFISLHRSRYIGAYTLVDLLIRVGIATLLLRWGYDIVAVVVTLLCAQVVSLGVAAYLAAGLGVPLRLAFERATVRRLVLAAPTFLSISVFATLYWRIDVVMLSKFGNMRDVGLYGAAYRIMDLTRILPQCLCLAVYPLVSQAAHTDLAKLRRVGTETLRFLWLATIPVVAGGTIVAGPLLAFSVGGEFRAASATLNVLIWTGIPYTMVRYYSYVIVGANRERVDLLLNVAMSGVNIALNLFLIPRYGPVGAALATSIAICIYATAQYVYLRRYLPGHLAPLPDIAKPLAAAGIMALFVWVRRTDQVGLLIGAASLVYIGALLVTRAVSIGELRLLFHGDVTTVLGSDSGEPTDSEGAVPTRGVVGIRTAWLLTRPKAEYRNASK